MSVQAKRIFALLLLFGLQSENARAALTDIRRIDMKGNLIQVMPEGAESWSLGKEDPSIGYGPSPCLRVRFNAEVDPKESWNVLSKKTNPAEVSITGNSVEACTSKSATAFTIQNSTPKQNIVQYVLYSTAPERKMLLAPFCIANGVKMVGALDAPFFSFGVDCTVLPKISNRIPMRVALHFFSDELSRKDFKINSTIPLEVPKGKSIELPFKGKSGKDIGNLSFFWFPPNFLPSPSPTPNPTVINKVVSTDINKPFQMGKSLAKDPVKGFHQKNWVVNAFVGLGTSNHQNSEADSTQVATLSASQVHLFGEGSKRIGLLGGSEIAGKLSFDALGAPAPTNAMFHGALEKEVYKIGRTTELFAGLGLGAAKMLGSTFGVSNLMSLQLTTKIQPANDRWGVSIYASGSSSKNYWLTAGGYFQIQIFDQPINFGVDANFIAVPFIIGDNNDPINYSYKNIAFVVGYQFGD